MARDYYETLGVNRSANAEEIKAAYKRLAKKHHPDVNEEKGSEEKFKEIQEAYSVLSDENKRKQYDQFGADFGKYGGFSGFQGGFTGSEFDFEDIFESMGFGGDLNDFFTGFRGSRQRSGPRRGEDIGVRLEVSFEEAVSGTKKQIEFERIEQCENCKGSGARPGTRATTCTLCHGTGYERSTRRTFLGTISTQTTCRNCRGAGEAAEDPCPICSGSKLARKRKKLTIEVPAGVDNGVQLRIRGHGNAGEKGAAHGNLIVLISVKPHPIFKRDGNDIFLELPISFSEAALGSEVEVPTLTGKAKLKIPPGTQSGTIFRMHGKGIKHIERKELGDQFAKVVVKIPEKLSKKQKELLQLLHEEEKTAAERKGLFDRFKGMFE